MGPTKNSSRKAQQNQEAVQVAEMLGRREEDKEVDALMNKLFYGPFQIGKCYFVRSTYYILGRLVDVRDGFLIFENASWVANTGYFGSFLEGKHPAEDIEYVGKAFVNMNDICDAYEWEHPLPTRSSSGK